MKNLCLFKSRPDPAKIFILFALTLITAVNLPGIKKAVDDIQIYKKVLSHQNIGYKFSGLETFLTGVPYAGYYTDKGPDDDEASKEFSQAQFILSPTILDFNNLDHEYLIFFCSNEKVALRKIKEMSAQPLRMNHFGVILAQRQSGTTPAQRSNP